VATSIDALAVGFSFAILGQDILPASALIGIITLALSFLGGAVLVAIGIRILVQGLLA